MTLEELAAAAQEGSIQTVVVGCSDFYGRLHGKRLDASYFMEHAMEGVTLSAASLSSHIDGELIAGLSFGGHGSSSEDLLMRFDHPEIRLLPWFPRTALVLADVTTGEGEEIPSMPRTLLRRQLDRLAERGWGVRAAAEFEFYLLRRLGAEFEGCPPGPLYEQGNRDYSILRSAEDEWLLGALRSHLNGLGVPVESSKVEHGPGQVEVNILYAEGMESADRAFLLRQATKETAALSGLIATFMAKPFTRESGSGCHLHLCLVDEEGSNLFAGDGDEELDPLFRAFIGGLQHLAPDLFLAYAPLLNSYKRFMRESFAPVANNWGFDNRLVAFRVVGRGEGRRIENRLPGADLNPYVSLAATIGAGLYGIDHGLEPFTPPAKEEAEGPDQPPLPRQFNDALRLFSESARARDVLGGLAVDDLAAFAAGESERFLAEVSDWERRHYLEAL